jgi:hypothetical protein
MKLTILATILSSFALLHNVHITHTTVQYNAETESLGITLKMPIEDLELAFEELGAKSLKIGTEGEQEGVDSMIMKYVQQRLIFAPNGTKMSYTWIGKETSKNLHDLYVYLELPNCNKNGVLETIEVKNTLLTEVFADQSNVVLFEIDDVKRNLTFTKNRAQKTVSLK